MRKETKGKRERERERKESILYYTKYKQYNLFYIIIWEWDYIIWRFSGQQYPKCGMAACACYRFFLRLSHNS